MFKVLDTKKEDRDPYLREDLAAFPYVNGGLFADETIEIPRITEEIFHIICDDMSRGFDWSAISPTIFGAVFESTLNPETRRKGGMHYTSIENIHKVIDPLFLDELKKEFNQIVSIPYEQKFITRRREITMRAEYKRKLIAFQEKIANLRFLDPACGSGNFLTETFLSLRRLENKVINEIHAKMSILDVIDPIKVSISQFYGIEINDFAVTVAKTALWIAESQMMQETEKIIQKELNFLPLKTNANIHEGNALRMDWNDIIPAAQLSYIMGNPPFVGARIMEAEQKNDVEFVFGTTWKNRGNLDYVTCWYKKAVELMKGTTIQCAFVSTNSIVQGDQVATLWKPLFEMGCHFNFAYKPFIWDSEANEKAHVHCVIIGFSMIDKGTKKLYEESQKFTKLNHMNGYLLDGPDVFIEKRSQSLCNVPAIGMGNQPIDDGNYLFSKEEMKNFLKKEPEAVNYFRKWYGSKEFINRSPRYCLWLGECPIQKLRKMKYCMERVTAVQRFRRKSKRLSTKKLANYPTRFQTENMPKGNFIVIPETSSQRRRYMPIGYLNDSCLCGNSLRLMPFATLYHFGVLESNVHMAWMRTVAGRLKSDYRYSKDIVYNNFPWPNPTQEQKDRIEKTAMGILDARNLYPEASLADLYDDLTMPQELRRAHQENDKAVMDAYGFNWRTMTEPECVQALMKMYVKLTEAEAARQGKVTKIKRMNRRKPKTEAKSYPMAAEPVSTYGKNEEK